jgi:2-polyprenyl-3-methyl-5-hydroxy-6-metoxy-1,4-benzoquinol methylase
MHPAPPVISRAQLSAGQSDAAIHRMVARALACRGVTDAVLVDVGCGHGALRPQVAPFVRRYIGVDVVRYETLDSAVEFHQIDLDTGALPTTLDAIADVVAAVETIEHLENPRAFVRTLARAARPGGWIVVTTPNVRSALSLATLVVKGQHSQFQDGSYPAHITPLLEVDLRRIARETGLTDIAIDYSRSGRMVFTPWRYPSWLAGRFPRACSDNVLLAARRAP